MGFIQAATDTVGAVGLVRQTVHGDDDAVEPGGNKGVGEILGHRLTVGADNRIKTRLMRLTDHDRQVFMEQGLTLKIELDDFGRVFDLR